MVSDENVRGRHVFIIQSCGQPVNDNIMELLLTVAAVRRSSASRITAVVPYFGYKHHRYVRLLQCLACHRSFMHHIKSSSLQTLDGMFITILITNF